MAVDVNAGGFAELVSVTYSKRQADVEGRVGIGRAFDFAGGFGGREKTAEASSVAMMLGGSTGRVVKEGLGPGEKAGSFQGD